MLFNLFSQESTKNKKWESQNLELPPTLENKFIRRKKNDYGLIFLIGITLSSSNLI